MWRDVNEEKSVADLGCVFCRVAAGQLPSRQVYSDDDIIAFHDVTPVAKVDVLVIPKRHVTRLEDSTQVDEALLGRLIRVGVEVAQKLRISDSGYRLAINQGADAGQVLDHLHLHVMGGQNLYPLGEVTTGTEG
ncbi:MAG: histidine triad nucleotide-binding protein [Chloroflexi bacterium]|nr:histidine triad nucleotide-binding protein [Chloroflexota bacterium]